MLEPRLVPIPAINSSEDMILTILCLENEVKQRLEHYASSDVKVGWKSNRRTVDHKSTFELYEKAKGNTCFRSYACEKLMSFCCLGNSAEYYC